MDQENVPVGKLGLLCSTHGKGPRQDRDGRTREELGLEGSTNLDLGSRGKDGFPPCEGTRKDSGQLT